MFSSPYLCETRCPPPHFLSRAHAAAEKEARKTEGTFGWHWSSIQLDNGVDLSSTYLWKVATKETVDKVLYHAPGHVCCTRRLCYKYRPTLRMLCSWAPWLF